VMRGVRVCVCVRVCVYVFRYSYFPHQKYLQYLARGGQNVSISGDLSLRY
jgi:hypothetical protein